MLKHNRHLRVKSDWQSKRLCSIFHSQINLHASFPSLLEARKSFVHIHPLGAETNPSKGLAAEFSTAANTYIHSSSKYFSHFFSFFPFFFFFKLSPHAGDRIFLVAAPRLSALSRYPQVSNIPEHLKDFKRAART